MLQKYSLLGMTKIMNCGMTCTVIEDNGPKDITVQFQDGTIISHRSRQNFKEGKIANPNFGRGSLLGQSKMMKCGMIGTVIQDEGCYEVTVQFEDGSIVNHCTRQNFKNGAISNPNFNKLRSRTLRTSILGQTQKMNCGLFCTVIEDNGSKDITIRFEDGEIVKHRKRAKFLKGNIAHPKLGEKYAILHHYSKVGDTNMMNCGMACTVIKYLNAMDISVQFEDGTIVEHKSVDAFQNGAIANPTLGNKYTRKLNTSILGESKRMNCGMICTVIEDNGSMDITVKFEDETIVNHRTRNCFFKGSISNPNYADKKSLPQAVVFYFIKKYFSDTQINYRPDWLKNPKTGRNLEIDIWIPSLKVGIEYDGVWRHSKETKLSKLKATLICQSDEIKFLITILERDTVVHTSDKHINYQLHYISSGSPTSSEYKSLFVELQEVIEQILRSLEIEAEVIITDELIQHAYDDYLESIYKSKIN